METIKNMGDKISRMVGGATAKVGRKNAAMMGCAGVVILVALWFIWRMFMSSKETFTSGSADSAKKQAELMFFFANWCPHCKTAKPEWASLKETMAGKSINGYSVIMTEVDCTENTDAIRAKCDKFGVEGFPTVILLKDGKKTTFEGNPTKANLTEFLQTSLMG